MEVHFTDEQARIVARFMRLQAERAERQVAELRAQSKAASSLAQKVSAGTVKLDETEVRVLQTVLSSLGVITRMAPELLKEGAAAQLEELLPLLDKAKRGIECR